MWKKILDYLIIKYPCSNCGNIFCNCIVLLCNCNLMLDDCYENNKHCLKKENDHSKT